MAVSRSSSPSAVAAFRTSASWASPNQPPSSRASARIRWSFGAVDGLRLFEARVEGEPACVLGTYDNGDDCELYFVATLPDHRGKGLARRLVHRAMLAARDRGLTVSSLQATKMGYPVYARLGYEPICKLEMWERRR